MKLILASRDVTAAADADADAKPAVYRRHLRSVPTVYPVVVVLCLYFFLSLSCSLSLSCLLLYVFSSLVNIL